jgi:hypothetical protein
VPQRPSAAYAFVCASLAIVTVLGMARHASSASSPAQIALAWEYVNLPQTMAVYTQASDRPLPLWKMGAVADLSGIPVGNLIDGTVTVPATSPARLILVFHNTTDHPLYFFAAPHQAAPPEASLGFKFHCLCLGNVYKVPPHRYWYRAVELSIGPGFQTHTPLRLTHALVAVDAKRARESVEK